MNIGILGYGNLGRALAERVLASEHNLVGIFTSRENYADGGEIKKRQELQSYAGKIDVLMIATASLQNCQSDAEEFLPTFNIIDSFDMHGKIAERKRRLDKIAKENKKIALTSVGWDPGILSMCRAIAKVAVGAENVNTFWGKGKSLGHTAALKKIEGVRDAVQFTVPIEESVLLARQTDVALSNFERHKRECYIVADEGADKEKIRCEIFGMEEYFSGYETDVFFVKEIDSVLRHSGDGHKGEVIATFDKGERRLIDIKLEMESNAALTANVMLSFLNVNNYLQNRGFYGAFTPLDIPLSFLISEEEWGKMI